LTAPFQRACRESKSTESIAVRDESLVKETKDNLGEKTIGRKTVGRDKNFQLRESLEPYNNFFLPKHAYFSSLYPTITDR
jgi:hypothetical protein